jgi:hypothetical protein
MGNKHKSLPIGLFWVILTGSVLLIGFQNCAPTQTATPTKASTTSSQSQSPQSEANQTIPPAPSQLNAVASSSTVVTLTWVNNSNNQSGVKIERVAPVAGPFSTGPGSFVFLANAPANTTSYADTAANPGSTYQYRISAFNSAGFSDVTSTVSISTPSAPSAPPSAPSNLTTSAAAATIVNLHWSDNSNNESYFTVERSAGGGAFTQVALPSANINQYTDINLNPATAYTYRLRAVNGAGSSPYSGTSAVTTLTATNTSSFTYVSVNVVYPNCASCHNATTAAAGVVLDSYNAVKNSASAMLNDMKSGKMPPGAPLSSTQISQVQAWVNAGSPNN